jgi:hypothetical protein
MAEFSYGLRDVSPENVMLAAMHIAERAHFQGRASGTRAVSKALGLSEKQTAACLFMAAQLRLVEAAENSDYVYVGDENLRRAPRDGLAQFFRDAAQGYPPFLLFVSYLARSFTEDDAARFTAAVFDIELDPGRAAKVLRRWALYAGVIRSDGKLDFEPTGLLEIGFLRRLAESLRDELATHAFVIDEMGHERWGHLQRQGVDLRTLSDALTKHEADPRGALAEVGVLVETFLAMLGRPQGVAAGTIVPLADLLADDAHRTILKTHRNLAYGIAGLRNAADHGPDLSTGKPWSLSPEASLIGCLQSLLLIRSASRYTETGEQSV